MWLETSLELSWFFDLQILSAFQTWQIASTEGQKKYIRVLDLDN